MIAQSSQVTGKAMVLAPSSDYTRRQPSFSLIQTPPKNFMSQIHWVRGKTQAVVTISNSVPTESNYSFTLNGLVDLAGLNGYFDQYCLYSVAVSIAPSFEGAGSTLYTFGTCLTAIDYDNVTNLGTAAAVEAYNSCVMFEMSPGQSIQRFYKPCVAPAIYNSSAAFSGYGISRCWIDSAQTGVPHYGFRSFFISNSVSGLSCTFDFDVVVGFRNNM
jgi:hypothetical protein